MPGTLRELAQRLRGEAMEGARVERLEVFVEGVDDQAERQLTLELGRAPPQRQAATLLGPDQQLVQERRLADPRLARHEQDLGRSRAPFLEQSLEQVQFVISANERLGQVDHAIRLAAGQHTPRRPV